MTHAEHRRERVIYRGHVQGVGFRATCAGIARMFPITGFVMNRGDGAVELEAQATAGDLERFLAAIADELAHRIHTAERTEIPPLAREGGFAIRY